MKVMFIPDARKNNSYQTNLSDSLSKEGILTYFDEGSVIRSTMKYRPDVLHIHWPYPFMMANSRFMTVIKSTCFICWLSILKISGMRIIWTVHNISDHEGKFKSLELFFGKILVRLCDRLITHCLSAKIEVEKIYGKQSQVVIVPHGNYVGQYKNVMTQSQARDKLKLCIDDIVFLYFGQIRPYKGVLELIDMFKKLKCENAKLLIVGKPLNDEIVTEVLNSSGDDSRIYNVLEFIPDDNIQIYMNAADVVVLPYKNVLTSGAVLLAMSFGKPIIAPNVKCIADTLDNSGSFLYSEDDSLISVMQHTLDMDRNVLIGMGGHNLKLSDQFSWDKIAKITSDVYKKCVVRTKTVKSENKSV